MNRIIMRKWILISLILLPLYNVLNAQEELENFQIENNSLVWQYVFETDLSFKELTEKIKESGVLENPEITDDKIISKTKQLKVLYKEAGFGSTWYVVGYFIQPMAKIEFKESRYRVTLTNMSLHLNQTSPVAGIAEKTVLEQFALNGSKTKFTRQFIKKSSKIYNFTFNKEFHFNKTTNIEDEEW